MRILETSYSESDFRPRYKFNPVASSVAAMKTWTMKGWLLVMLCGAGVASASEYPRVDAALAECDARVAQMRAEFAKTPAAPPDKAWITARLQHMVDVDQYVRRFTQEGFARGFSAQENAIFGPRIAERMTAVDIANTAELKTLLPASGWFGISEYGERASTNAWLLIQHADKDPQFQREIVKRLEPLAATGEVKPSNYALLFDRVALSFNDPDRRTLQRYGTQGQCTGPGTWAPFPVEDPDKLDERRRSVGLMPEAEYQQMFKDLCHESTEDSIRKAVEAAKAGH